MAVVGDMREWASAETMTQSNLLVVISGNRKRLLYDIQIKIKPKKFTNW